MSVKPDAGQTGAEAVAGLRAALIRSDGVADALRVCWYRNPLVASTLMSESLRRRFPPGCDLRLVTAFTARIRGDRGTGFPGREAEAVIRGCLGETRLLDAVHPGQFSYPELGIAILGRLFAEWCPGEAELREWFEHVKEATRAMREHCPSLADGEPDWMYQSPFAAPLREARQGQEG